MVRVDEAVASHSMRGAVVRPPRGTKSKGPRGLTSAMFALVVAVLVGIGGVTSPASAALNYTYNGSDPHSTRCDQSRVGLRSITMKDPANGALIGYAYLRYSTSCETEWVTVNYNSGYTVLPYVWRQNQSGTNLGVSNFSPGGGTEWTSQLTGMRYATACGGVHVYRGNYQTWVGWYYIGCA